MNMRLVTVVALVSLIVLALGMGVLLAAVLWPQPLAAQSSNAAPRQITVVGEGQATAPPDTASVQIGVQTDAATAREALSANNTQMRALIAKLQELGIAERDLQTSGFSIYPRYSNDGRQVIGYQVSNLVTVKIRQLAQAGTLLDQVVDVGANQINGISFLIDDPAPLQQTARQAAIADARRRAEAMAQAAGVQLGPILAISETISAPPVPYPMTTARAQDAGSVPVQPGEQTITAQVQISFELR